MRSSSAVSNEAAAGRDPFAELRFLGIDEISHRRGQQYITVVVDHESGQLIWAKPGRSKDTVRAFFDDLGVERAHQLEAVSADGATWITDVVAERAPQATICCDPFHIVSWATDALDEVRRQVWNDLRRAGDDAAAKRLKGARWALWKNPENLSGRQHQRLAEIQRTNRSLYRAYLLKEGLRAVLHEPATATVELLDDWLAWASRSKLPSFVKLARTIRAYRPSIEAAIDLRLSNALVESVNQRLLLVMRRGFGFHSAEAVIALGMLSLGGLCPPLPGRQLAHERVS